MDANATEGVLQSLLRTATVLAVTVSSDALTVCDQATATALVAFPSSEGDAAPLVLDSSALHGSAAVEAQARRADGGGGSRRAGHIHCAVHAGGEGRVRAGPAREQRIQARDTLGSVRFASGADAFHVALVGVGGWAGEGRVGELESGVPVEVTNVSVSRQQVGAAVRGVRDGDAGVGQRGRLCGPGGPAAARQRGGDWRPLVHGVGGGGRGVHGVARAAERAVLIAPAS